MGRLVLTRTVFSDLADKNSVVFQHKGGTIRIWLTPDKTVDREQRRFGVRVVVDVASCNFPLKFGEQFSLSNYPLIQLRIMPLDGARVRVAIESDRDEVTILRAELLNPNAKETHERPKEQRRAA